MKKVRVRDVRQINIELTHRVETGALQIGEDWPGLFVRGDSCMALVEVLEYVLGKTDTPGFNATSFANYLLSRVNIDVLGRMSDAEG